MNLRDEIGYYIAMERSESKSSELMGYEICKIIEERLDEMKIDPPNLMESHYNEAIEDVKKELLK